MAFPFRISHPRETKHNQATKPSATMDTVAGADAAPAAGHLVRSEGAGGAGEC